MTVVESPITANAAISYVANNGGGTVFFPNGVYENINLMLPSGKNSVYLIGESRDGTILKCSEGDLIALSSLAVTRDIQIRNMTLDGQGEANNGINASYIYEGKIENVLIKNFVDYAVYAGSHWIANVVERLKTDLNGNSVFLGDNCNANTIRNSRISASTSGIGVHFYGDHSYSNRIVGNVLESNDIGVFIQGTQNQNKIIVISENYLSNYTVDLKAVGAVNRNLMGVFFQRNWIPGSSSQSWLYLVNGYNFVIQDNVNAKWHAYKSNVNPIFERNQYTVWDE